MTLPKQLAEARDQAAEEYRESQRTAGISSSNDLFAFSAGADWLYQQLLSAAPNFNQMDVSRRGIERMRLGVAVDSAFIRGAREQHSQDAAAIAAHKERADALEKTVEELRTINAEQRIKFYPGDWAAIEIQRLTEQNKILRVALERIFETKTHAEAIEIAKRALIENGGAD